VIVNTGSVTEGTPVRAVRQEVAEAKPRNPDRRGGPSSRAEGPESVAGVELGAPIKQWRGRRLRSDWIPGYGDARRSGAPIRRPAAAQWFGAAGKEDAREPKAMPAGASKGSRHDWP